MSCARGCTLASHILKPQRIIARLRLCFAIMKHIIQTKYLKYMQRQSHGYSTLMKCLLNKSLGLHLAGVFIAEKYGFYGNMFKSSHTFSTQFYYIWILFDEYMPVIYYQEKCKSLAIWRIEIRIYLNIAHKLLAVTRHLQIKFKYELTGGNAYIYICFLYFFFFTFTLFCWG